MMLLGTKFLYTTHGWTLVAAVLEGATKQKFPDLMIKLFKDLGLENTYLEKNQPIIYNRARWVNFKDACTCVSVSKHIFKYISYASFHIYYLSVLKEND